jgi:hypothetical protein
VKIAGQFAAYALFFMLVAALSAGPGLRLLGDDEAIVSVSFSHAAKRIGECTRLSQDELDALPPNMRKPDRCPRERHPLRIEMLLDGQSLFEASVSPSGLHSDGKATVYERVTVSAGIRELSIHMNDSGTSDRDDYSVTEQVQISPGQNLVVYFDADAQQFKIEQTVR